MAVTSPKPFIDPLIEAIDLHSEVNGSDYQLRIRLPASYRAGQEQRYPVFVVLDAEVSFGLAGDTAALEAIWSRTPWAMQSRAPLPELIVVGVALPGLAENQVRRNYEYMPALDLDDVPEPAASQLRAAVEHHGYRQGGATTFLEVMQQEILPTIERLYRTDPGRRILFGQSAGGTFCCYTLLTRPETFTDYILVSPGLPDETLFRLEADRARSHDDLRAGVFIAAGGREIMDPLNILSRTARFAEALQIRNYPNLRLRTWFIPDASHVQTAAPSIARGLNELLG
jgi:predicted alpha/beta superfamily hydrolase